MVFGLEESDNVDVRDSLNDLLRNFNTIGVSSVSDCFRVGPVKPGAVRPMKVIFHSSEAASRILQSSALLKDHTRYCKVFLTPDRTREE